MEYYVSPATGFPFDTDQKPDGTNTTNIGIHLASLAAATEMGFIPKEKASKRAEEILDSLLKLQHWKGFFANTVNVFGKTEAQQGGQALSDFNKLPAGLIMIRQEFPNLSKKCTTLLDRMDWSVFYNPSSKSLYGGFDVTRGEALKWNMNLLASDTRLASFFIIATGAAPPEVWYNLNRGTEKHYGLRIIKPSWYGGGIFMHGICGLFLDERQTEVGKSMADFAYVQMLFARDIGSPVWGWSSCYAPWGDYVGWGGLRGNVVTPHAAALAVIYYPNKVTQDLRALEKFGLRRDSQLTDGTYPFGFRDSVDIDTAEIYQNYVTALDQGMLFLSLANYLNDGIVWKIFEKDPIVKKGKKLLGKYFSPHPEYITLYKKRDSERLPEKAATTPAQTTLRLPFTAGEKTDRLQIDYDLSRANQKVISEDLKSSDISAYNALSFKIRGDREQRFTHSLRIELEGKNNGAIYRFKGITDDWRKITIPLSEFGAKHTGWEGMDSYWGGFITDRSKMKKIKFVLDLLDVSEGKGRIFLSDLSLERVDPDQIRETTLSLNDFPDSPVWKKGLVDDFETTAGWTLNQSRGASINIKAGPGKNNNALEINYDLGSVKTGEWVVIEKEHYFSLTDDNCEFKFLVKAGGSENNFEFKLIDINNSTFGKKISLPTTGGKWREITVKASELSYWWGGDSKLDRVKKISFALSTKNGGNGTVFLDDLRMISTLRLVLKNTRLTVKNT